MTKSLSSLSLILSALLLMLAMPAPSTAQSTADDEAQIIAQEAYIYLCPLITMDVTRTQFINTDPKVNPIGGPANAFSHARAFRRQTSARWFVRISIRSIRPHGSI